MPAKLATLCLTAALVAACGSAGGPQAAATATASPTPAPTVTPTKAPSRDTLAAIKARGKLIASVKREESPRGVNQDVAHFQKRNFEVGIAGAVAQRILGDPTKIELLIVPKLERIPLVERGEADIVISMVPIDETTRARLDFSQAYAVGGYTIMAKAGSGIRGIEDLATRRVAIAMQEVDEIGGPLGSLAGAAYVSVSTQPYPNFMEAAAALESGAADALVSNSINIAVHMKAKPGVFETPADLLWDEEYGIGVARGDAALLAEVNAVLARMKSSGALATLATQVGFPSPAR